MTTARWTDEMLDVLASATARNAGGIAELRGIMENFAQQLNVFVEEGRSFRQDMQLIRQDMQLMRQDMQLMQSDIRGLQTENRRILERLENND